jgi:hypothetical protein
VTMKSMTFVVRGHIWQSVRGFKSELPKDVHRWFAFIHELCLA